MVREGLNELLAKHKVYIFNELVKCSQLLSLDEQIHFTNTVMKVMIMICNDEADITIWTEIEYELYVKYRHKMRYFSTSGFINLFFRKSEITLKIFQEGLKITEPYTEEEYQEFFIQIFFMFENIKTFLYTADPTSPGLSKVDDETEKLLSAPAPTGKHKTFDTRTQQVLLMYYITKGLGIREKIEIPVTKIAQFYHALLGWEYTDIDNSPIYKLLKKAPHIKTDKKQLYTDLLWVKDQIKILGLISVLELIDKELKELEMQIK